MSANTAGEKVFPEVPEREYTFKWIDYAKKHPENQKAVADAQEVYSRYKKHILSDAPQRLDYLRKLVNDGHESRFIEEEARNSGLLDIPETGKTVEELVGINKMTPTAQETYMRTFSEGFGSARMGAFQAGGDIAGIIGRGVDVVAGTNLADQTSEMQSEIEQARKEAGETWLGRGVRGTVRSVIPMVAGGALGKVAQASKAKWIAEAGYYAPQAAAALIQGNQSWSEGKKAGLGGTKLAAYAASNAAAEFVFSAALSKLGKRPGLEWLGGTESGIMNAGAFRKSFAKGIGEGLKSIGLATASELGEEEMTSLTQLAIGRISGVDPKALSKESLLQTGFDTAVQVALMSGAVHGTNIAASYPGIRSDKKVQSNFRASAERMGMSKEMMDNVFAKAEESAEKGKDYHRVLLDAFRTNYYQTEQGAGIWAETHPEQAVALADKETPSRKDFEAAGLPKMDAPERAAVAESVRQRLMTVPEEPVQVESAVEAPGAETIPQPDISRETMPEQVAQQPEAPLPAPQTSQGVEPAIAANQIAETPVAATETPVGEQQAAPNPIEQMDENQFHDYAVKATRDLDTLENDPNVDKTSQDYQQRLAEAKQRFDESHQERARRDDANGVPPVTSIKNRLVDEQRAGRDLAPIPDATPESFEQWLEGGEKLLKDDPNLGDKLIAEQQEKPREWKPEETAAMNIYYKRAIDASERAENDLIAAFESGDEAKVAEARKVSDNMNNQLQQIEEAVKSAGTKSGRGLAARKIELNNDLSLAALTRKARVAKGGKQLTQEESVKIKELSDKLEAYKQQYAKLQETLQLREIDKNTAADVKDIAKGKKRGKSAKILADDQSIAEKWEILRRDIFTIRAINDPQQNAMMIKHAVDLVLAYVKKGIHTVSEIMAALNKEMGKDAIVLQDTFQTAWNQLKADGKIPALEINTDKPSSIAIIARKIQRSLVEMGVTDRDTIVDTVHNELSQAMPDWTRRQTMNALSGYGQFKQLTKDAISNTIRDINGQLQQLAKLEDMQKGEAPKKTGVERRVPTDEERRLIQQVNEAKRKGGYIAVDPEQQLRTALESAKTAVRNRLADLEQQIATKEKTVKSKTELKPDEELTRLRSQRDALKEQYDKIFPREPLSEAQRVIMSTRAVDRSIAQLKDELKRGDVMPKGKSKKLSSPELDAKRAKLENLRSLRDELRESINPKLTPEERANLNYKRALQKRLADYQQRIANKDFAKREVKPRELDKEATDLKYKIEEEKTKFKIMQEQWENERQTTVQKGIRYGEELWDFLGRGFRTAFDLSSILRQGAKLTYGHMINSATVIPEAVKSMISRKMAFDSNEKMKALPNADKWKIAKIEMTDPEGPLNLTEELMRSRIFNRIPGIAGSARGFATYLNWMRALAFEQMIVSQERNGKVDTDTLKDFGKMINQSSGRGDWGKRSTWAVPMSRVFWSPSNFLANVQYMTGTPLWRAKKENRAVIAKEYARQISGRLAFISMCALYSLAQDKDDPDKITIEFDPRATDFLKMRIGDTRVDLFEGMQQIGVLAARLYSGETKKQSGLVVPIRDKATDDEIKTQLDAIKANNSLSPAQKREASDKVKAQKVPWGGKTIPDVIGGFVRSKLAPTPGSIIDALAGKNVVGDVMNPVAMMENFLTPMGARDAYDSFTQLHFPLNIVVPILTEAGAGGSTYESFAEKDIGGSLYHLSDKKEVPETAEYYKQAVKGMTWPQIVEEMKAEAKSRGQKTGGDAFYERLMRLKKRLKMED